MKQPRIYADFQNLDDANRLRLNCAGTLEDLERNGVQLQEGHRLTFYMDDDADDGQADELLLDGVVHYDSTQRCWVAEVDWTALRHASDEERNGSAKPSRTGLSSNPGKQAPGA